MAELETKKKSVTLEKLVSELMKDQPNSNLVKQLTSELGMDYSVDPMTQMNTVLQSMNTVLLRPNRRRDLESN
ncbi:hypothetical protein [Bdellovibrio sp. HCB209]|uniref:hypothetical protein n=1 Tax=Bdellovibrio sp. HCB209 TaxID=3394354 RepID=UPI0039B5E2D3